MPRRSAVYTAVAIGLGLSVFGIVLIFSASHRIYGWELAMKQSMWLVVGLFLAIVINQISRKWLNRSTWPLYATGLGLLIATLLFGVKVRGDRSWLDLGFMHLQASEFMKVFMVLAFARISQHYSTGDYSLNKALLLLTVTFVAPLSLVILQPDLGTSIVYLMIFVFWLFTMGLWTEGFTLFLGSISGIFGVFFVLLKPGNWFNYYLWFRTLFDEWSSGVVLLILASLGGIIAVWPYVFRRRIKLMGAVSLNLIAFLMGTQLTSMFEPYQKQRLLVYFNPYQAPMESGYNIIQAQIAIGSGGWFGQGYLQGSQSQLGFIPELWTDFIFSVAVEEFGFLCGAILVLLFLVYVYSFFSTAIMAADWEGYYISSGLGLIVMTHVILNIGVCVGMIPVVGLPLPFLSYGGSFLVSNWIIIGIMTVVSRRLSGQALLKSAPASKRVG